MSPIKSKRLSSLRVLTVCLFLVAIATSPLSAEVFNGENGSSDYNDPLNWENDTLPGTAGGEFAIIGQAGVGGDGVAFLNPATVDLNATPATPNLPGDLRVGNGADGDGTLNHTAGDLTTNPGNWSALGQDGTAANPSIGRYNMSGTATFNSGDPFSLGADGGSHAAGLPNQGLLTIADTAALNVGALNVGRNGDNYGEVTQTGGVVNVGNWFNIGDEGGATGLYNMSGGSVLTNEFTVGQKDGADGTLNLSSDAAVVAANMRVGRNPGGTGLVSITGDQVSLTASQLTVGGDDGALNSGEGTLSFTSASSVSAITVLNDVTLNDGSVEGFAKLVVNLETSPPPAGSVLLVDNQGANAVNGTFMGLPQGALVANSGGRTISYNYGDGNDIALVPELATGLLLLVGLGAGFCMRRRRSR